MGKKKESRIVLFILLLVNDATEEDTHPFARPVSHTATRAQGRLVSRHPHSRHATLMRRFAYNPVGNGRWVSLNLKRKKKAGGRRRKKIVPVKAEEHDDDEERDEAPDYRRIFSSALRVWNADVDLQVVEESTLKVLFILLLVNDATEEDTHPFARPVSHTATRAL
jgi:lysophospholipase L1-like esterase